jgi:hypothetical protein
MAGLFSSAGAFFTVRQAAVNHVGDEMPDDADWR